MPLGIRIPLDYYHGARQGKLHSEVLLYELLLRLEDRRGLRQDSKKRKEYTSAKDRSLIVLCSGPLTLWASGRRTARSSQ